MINRYDSGRIGPKTWRDYENSNRTPVFFEPRTITQKHSEAMSPIEPSSYFYVTEIEYPSQEKVDENWEMSFANSVDVLEDLASEAEEDRKKGTLKAKGWDEL